MTNIIQAAASESHAAASPEDPDKALLFPATSKLPARHEYGAVRGDFRPQRLEFATPGMLSTDVAMPSLAESSATECSESSQRSDDRVDRVETRVTEPCQSDQWEPSPSHGSTRTTVDMGGGVTALTEKAEPPDALSMTSAKLCDLSHAHTAELSDGSSTTGSSSGFTVRSLAPEGDLRSRVQHLIEQRNQRSSMGGAPFYGGSYLDAYRKSTATGSRRRGVTHSGRGSGSSRRDSGSSDGTVNSGMSDRGSRGRDCAKGSGSMSGSSSSSSLADMPSAPSRAQLSRPKGLPSTKRPPSRAPAAAGRNGPVAVAVPVRAARPAPNVLQVELCSAEPRKASAAVAKTPGALALETSRSASHSRTAFRDVAAPKQARRSVLKPATDTGEGGSPAPATPVTPVRSPAASQARGDRQAMVVATRSSLAGAELSPIAEADRPAVRGHVSWRTPLTAPRDGAAATVSTRSTRSPLPKHVAGQRQREASRERDEAQLEAEPSTAVERVANRTAKAAVHGALAHAKAQEVAAAAWAQAKAEARAVVREVLKVAAQSPGQDIPPLRKKFSLAHKRRSLSFDVMRTRNSPKTRAMRDGNAAASDEFENAPLLLSLLREFRMWLGVGRSNVRRTRTQEPMPLLRLIGPRASRSLRIWGGQAYAVPPIVALKQAQVRYLTCTKWVRRPNAT